jgi:predicted RNA-binding protein with PIN domain
LTTTVFVDAQNVRRSVWPNIPEDRLAELACAWASASGRRAVVVFDGRAPGGLVGERELDDHCTLVGTGAETADDWLIRTAERYRAEGRPFWLVTSDRALRAAAAGGAERTIGGGSFARELLAS